MRRSALKRTLAIGLLAPLLCLGSAVGVASASGHAVTTRVKQYPGTINFAFPTTGGTEFLPLEFAKDLGMFAKFGLNVNVEVVSSAVSDAAFESGSLQFGDFAAPLNEAAYAQGVPIQMLGIYGEHTTGVLVVSKGISSIKDLAGKAIGTLGGISLPTILPELLLVENHIPLSSVTFVPTGASSTQEMISGEFNALDASQGNAAVILANLPGSSIIYNFKKILFPCCEIWGYSPWVSAHKAETVVVLKAVNAAIVKWETDPTFAEHEISIYQSISVPADSDLAYTTLEQVLNHGSLPLHLPSTHDEAAMYKILRQVGYPTMYNKYADKGKVWTPTYWDAAFGSAS